MSVLHMMCNLCTIPDILCYFANQHNECCLHCQSRLLLEVGWHEISALFFHLLILLGRIKFVSVTHHIFGGHVDAELLTHIHMIQLIQVLMCTFLLLNILTYPPVIFLPVHFGFHPSI